MPIVRSWRERAGDSSRAVADVSHLLRFRLASVRRPRRALTGLGVAFALTSASAAGPALLPGAGAGTGLALEVRTMLPSLLAGFVVLTTVAAVASGGGRELLPRDQAAIHPISATTDHLGALLLAPLNVAWLVQGWALLGAVAWALGPGVHLVGAQVITLLWLTFATALAQAVAWTVEVVRRGPGGVVLVRVGVGLLGAATLWAHLAGRLPALMGQGPTRWVAAGMLHPGSGLTVVLALVVLTVTAVVVGAVPTHAAARRTARDESRLESSRHPARSTPASDRALLLRMDRASVWRSVPMRRGLLVLTLGPGLVAVVGGLPWSTVVVLPGLVVSGGALLFGVNAWCLDGRGLLWRESLPVSPEEVFAVRARVLAEWIGLAALGTLVLAGLRAGVPTASELAAVLCAWAVVTLQVVAVSMSWSDRSPFAADLRSARATPAPPSAMVGYAGRLAISTTLTALFFSACALAPWWWLSLVVSVPFVAWSWPRLRRARGRWLDPEARARVVVAVTA